MNKHCRRCNKELFLMIRVNLESNTYGVTCCNLYYSYDTNKSLICITELKKGG